jgi:uncharacterized protein YecE (DUF72 family)
MNHDDQHEYGFPEIDVLAEQMKADGISADDAYCALMNRYEDRAPAQVEQIINKLWPKEGAEENGQDS